MGIIYRATNLTNGKVYIGQTTTPLKVRIYNHFRNAKRNPDGNYFYRALNKYDRKDWKWDILIKAEKERLNDLERFYIAECNSYGKGGYNSTIGGSWEGEGSPSYNPTIHKLYNGIQVIEGTLSELSKITDVNYQNLRNFLSGKGKRCGNWVRYEDKDRYEELQGIITLVHKKYGIMKMKRKAFVKIWGLTRNKITALELGRKVGDCDFITYEQYLKITL